MSGRDCGVSALVFPACRQSAKATRTAPAQEPRAFGFSSGVADTLPSGNTDIAPTVLWLLGLRDEAAKMDGRVLGEALSVSDAPALKSYETKRLAARQVSTDGAWEQYLQVSEVNGVRYLDEGNGSVVLAR